MIYAKIVLILVLVCLLFNFSFNSQIESMCNLSVKNKIYKLMLQKTSKICEKNGVRCFISSGTLLGYYREGKFMEHDYDIDVGIFKNECDKHTLQKIVDDMESNGFIHYRTFGNYNSGLEYSFYYPGTKIGNRAKIDIFLHYQDKIINSEMEKTTNSEIEWEEDTDYISWISYFRKRKIVYSVPKFTLKKINFMGVPVYAPNDIEKYLIHHYGSKWMIPQKKYHYAYSPKSIKMGNYSILKNK